MSLLQRIQQMFPIKSRELVGKGAKVAFVLFALTAPFAYAQRKAKIQESDGDLSLKEKKHIADLVNKALGNNGSQLIKPDDIEVDSGQPTDVQVGYRESRAFKLYSIYPFDSVTYVDRKELSTHKYLSTIVIERFYGNKKIESRFVLKPKQNFPEYAFDPIFSKSLNCVFFKFGRNESSSDAFGFYVLYLNKGNVEKVDPDYISGSYTPLSSNGRYIVYTTNNDEKNYIKIFDGVSRKRFEVTSGRTISLDYSWVQSKKPILSYSSANSSGEANKSSFIYDVDSKSAKHLLSNASAVVVFGNYDQIMYTDTNSMKVFIKEDGKEAEELKGSDQIKPWYFDNITYNSKSRGFIASSLINGNGGDDSDEADPNYKLTLMFLSKEASFSSSSLLIKSNCSDASSSIISFNDMGRYIYVAVQSCMISNRKESKNKSVLVYKYDSLNKSWDVVRKYNEVVGMGFHSNIGYKSIRYNE